MIPLGAIDAVPLLAAMLGSAFVGTGVNAMVRRIRGGGRVAQDSVVVTTGQGALKIMEGVHQGLVDDYERVRAERDEAWREVSRLRVELDQHKRSR